MRRVQVSHRQAKDWADWLALGTVRVLRWGMDFVTGYRHPKPGQERDSRFQMTEQKWLTRFIFLESVAGVPGMVGGMLRHLRSLRRMKRDNGWYTFPPVHLSLDQSPLTISGSKRCSTKPRTNACTC